MPKEYEYNEGKKAQKEFEKDMQDETVDRNIRASAPEN